MVELYPNNGVTLTSEQFSVPVSERLPSSSLRAWADRATPASFVDVRTGADRMDLTSTGIEQSETRLVRPEDSHHRRYVGRVQLDNSRIRVTDRFEGVVTQVEDGFFQASLGDSGGDLDLTAEFALDKVSAPDLELVEPGAPFFVIVGRLTLRGGHASTVTSLMFRRLGRLNASDVDFHRERGAKYRSLLGFDDA